MEKGKKPILSRAATDGLIISAIVAAVWSFLAQWEVLVPLSKMVGQMEVYNLAEFARGLIIIGVGSLIFAWRRLSDFQREARLRGSAEDEIVWLAQHDPLTALPNRQYLLELSKRPEFSNVEQSNQQHAVLVLDLDGFKTVNDLLGHAGGDELLVQIADRLRWLCDERTLVRMGGDEFVIVLRGAGKTEAEIAAIKILDMISKPFQLVGNQMEVGVSVGIALMPDSAQTLEEAVTNADAALYEAKQQSKGDFRIFNENMGLVMTERSLIEQKLRKALRDDDLCVHYQPYLDMKNNKIIGFEALARWEQLDGSFIPPGTFIEIAEKTGQIIELSEVLFKKACLDAKAWPSDMTLSFNLSASQLRDRLLGSRILKLLEECDFPATRLELEVTESCFVHDHETVIETLLELKHAGVRIALDDFGTGYSSFSRLTKVEFDKIKIDKLFVQECNDSPRMNKIVSAIVALSKSLETTIVAEGIETPEQFEAMRGLGCDVGQGYLFGRPAPAHHTMQLLAADQAKVSGKLN